MDGKLTRKRIGQRLGRHSEPAACSTCGGSGVDEPTPSFSESHPLPVPCPDCNLDREEAH